MTEESPVRIVERAPTVPEYLDLTGSVGWSDYVSAETAEIALANSLHTVVAEKEGVPVGMARIIGDGAIFLYVQDLIVRPGLQGHGVGESLMNAVMAWLDAHAPDRAFVGLFSAAGKAPFYERFGFAAREPDRPGMFQHVRPSD